jgi:hypothetical protein
VVVANTLI